MSQTNGNSASVGKFLDLMREQGVCEEDLEAVATILAHNDPERKLSQDELTQRYLAILKAEHNLWLCAANPDDVPRAMDRAEKLVLQWARQEGRRANQELFKSLGIDEKFLDEVQAL